MSADGTVIREALAYYSAGLAIGANSSRRLTDALAEVAEFESELAALRVELQAACDECDEWMARWRVEVTVNRDFEATEAALLAAQEALREIAEKDAFNDSDVPARVLRSMAQDALARAVLVEGAGGLADSNWCNRP